MMSPRSPYDGYMNQKVANIVGPWIIGGFLDYLLQGIIFSQVANYFNRYPNDKLWTKLAVAGLCIITTLKSVQTFVVIWTQTVDNYNNFLGLIDLLLKSVWETGNCAISASVGAYVQVYYCYRLYIISRSFRVIIPIATVLTAAFIGSIVAAVATIRGDGRLSKDMFNLHLALTVLGDLMLAVTTAYYLLDMRQRSGSSSRNTLDSLLLLCFQCAIPIAVTMLAQLIASAVGGTPMPKKIGTDICVVLSELSPKVYGVCMMYTINTRKSPRSDSHTSSKSETETKSSYTRAHATRTAPDAQFDTVSRIQMQIDCDLTYGSSSSGVSEADRTPHDAPRTKGNQSRGKGLLTV